MTQPEPDGLRRRLLQGAGLGALVLACPPLRAQPAVKPLLIVSSWEISGLAPAASGYIFTRLQVTETLLDARDDGTPEAALAASWKASPDGLEWHFELRPGARFHDGSPVTAQAVARSLNLARTPPGVLSMAPIRSIEAAGEKLLRIRLAIPYMPLLSLLAHSSTMILAPASFEAKGTVREIIGSGPYRISKLEAPHQVETRLSEHYDGPRPAIAQVRYMAAGRAETRTLMAESGQADLAYNLDPVSITRLRQRTSLSIASVTLPRTLVVKLNAGLPGLKDLRVRQALSLAIDRPGIARALLRDPELAASQLMPPSLGAWHDPSLPALKRDPVALRQLMQQAGWTLGAEGWHDAQGQLLRLKLQTFPDRPELPVLAAALQDQWRQAGFAVSVSIGNSGDIPLAHRDGSLQMGLAARNYATVPDPTGTLAQDFGPHGGDWGATHWSSPVAVDALQRLVRGGLDKAQLAAQRKRLLQTLHEELPLIPVCWYRQNVAISKRLEGVSLDPLERSFRLTGMRWKA
ncbi:ABC transporter substrate-binding protein [Uliginosibacterium sp. TH139]|uniref:ABC transporter substrate-binding protein n=1 Tax=Uliginosibacterium sp. TH139 TaxID=2067453 RepID=UPI000C79C045|nr:ABC transporter substrate-binding protein [Uliginosibacterium sp. TH139]PLK48064.1 ABC transporter substrate-binding protein [Uliginosibacterium sp. TH139]